MNRSLLEEHPMYLGCTWHPEHWSEDRWDEDCRLMAEAGMSLVRVGDGAWSSLEPTRGIFTFDWLEKAVATATKHGLRTVLVVPTDEPPRWMAEAHPEIIPSDSGRFDATNLIFKGYCSKLAENLGERFGQLRELVGWQVPMGHIPAHSPGAAGEFRLWLQRRFPDLARLNESWCTTHNSLDYTSWNQIQPPGTETDPALRLAWRHFTNAVNQEFVNLHVDALRQHIGKRQWVSAALSAEAGVDAAAIGESLDFCSWSSDLGSSTLDSFISGEAMDRLRGVLGENVWVLYDSGSWQRTLRPAPGETRSAVWHLIGHGADALCAWRWRPSPAPGENLEGCLLSADGSPRPVFDEVVKVAKELAAHRSVLKGTVPLPRIALLDTGSDTWALIGDDAGKTASAARFRECWYRPLEAMGVSCDILDATRDVNDYDLILAPRLTLLEDDTAKGLIDWVQAGGHLMIGPRCGQRDGEGALRPQQHPGILSEHLGGHIVDGYAINEAAHLTGSLGDGQAQRYVEYLQPAADDMEILATYEEGFDWWSGMPAIATRAVGKGRLTWVGTQLVPEFAQRLFRWACKESGIPAHDGLPEGTQILERHHSEDGRTVRIVVNHTRSRIAVPGVGPGTDLLSGLAVEDPLVIGPLGVALIAPES